MSRRCPIGCDAPARRVARYRTSRAIEPGAVLTTPQPGWVDVLGCEECGHEWLDAEVEWTTPADAAHLGLALQYDADPEGERRRARALLDVVRRYRTPPGRLFDLGCGLGTLLRLAREERWDVAGNDIVAGAVERLRAETGIEAHVGTLADLPAGDAAFDAVTAYCVLPHVRDPLDEARRIAALLAVDGVFVAEMPAPGFYRRAAKLLARIGIDWGVRNVYYAGHRHGYTDRSVATLLARAGLQVVDVAPFRMPRGTSGRRFALQGGIGGRLGSVAVLVGDIAARALRMPNHLVVVARKPAT